MSLKQLNTNPNVFTFDYYIESTKNGKITLEITTDLAACRAERDKALADIQLKAGRAMHDICGLGADPELTDTVDTLIAFAGEWHYRWQKAEAALAALTAQRDELAALLYKICGDAPALIANYTGMCAVRESDLAAGRAALARIAKPEVK